MHIFFSGIGGTAIGPLALIAHQAGYQVSGSDKQDSQYIQYLKTQGISNIHLGQTTDNIAQVHHDHPIDWFVYSSAVAIENPNHPEIVFAKNNNIKSTKRDELLNHILNDAGLKLLAVAGTHGKTTTTAMAIWLFKQLGIPVSYSVGAKIPFGNMGQFDKNSQYFIYECDEFDKNFLSFHPEISIITGIDYDHHEIFPTRQDYQIAFQQFLDQAKVNLLWQSDVTRNQLKVRDEDIVLEDSDELIDDLRIVGKVNRRDAFQVMKAVQIITSRPIEELAPYIEQFPGLSRRFEKIRDNLYTDYAHTIPKIKGCLQTAREVSENIVVVYEPLTNRRQHYIKHEYKDLFNGIKHLYWVPSYMAREDPDQKILKPTELISYMEESDRAQPAELNNQLKQTISDHLENGDLVICLSGGGGGSLDEWLRKEFKS